MDGPAGMGVPNFTVSCWAESYGQAKSIAEAVRATLNCYSGTVGNVKIYAIFLINETDLFEQPPDVLGLRRYNKQLSFRVWFQE